MSWRDLSGVFGTTNLGKKNQAQRNVASDQTSKLKPFTSNRPNYAGNFSTPSSSNIQKNTSETHHTAQEKNSRWVNVCSQKVDSDNQNDKNDLWGNESDDFLKELLELTALYDKAPEKKPTEERMEIIEEETETIQDILSNNLPIPKENVVLTKDLFEKQQSSEFLAKATSSKDDGMSTNKPMLEEKMDIVETNTLEETVTYDKLQKVIDNIVITNIPTHKKQLHSKAIITEMAPAEIIEIKQNKTVQKSIQENVVMSKNSFERRQTSESMPSIKDSDKPAESKNSDGSKRRKLVIQDSNDSDSDDSIEVVSESFHSLFQKKEKRVSDLGKKVMQQKPLEENSQMLQDIEQVMSLDVSDFKPLYKDVLLSGGEPMSNLMKDCCSESLNIDTMLQDLTHSSRSDAQYELSDKFLQVQLQVIQIQILHSPNLLAITQSVTDHCLELLCRVISELLSPKPKETRDVVTVNLLSRWNEMKLHDPVLWFPMEYFPEFRRSLALLIYLTKKHRDIVDHLLNIPCTVKTQGVVRTLSQPTPPKKNKKNDDETTDASEQNEDTIVYKNLLFKYLIRFMEVAATSPEAHLLEAVICSILELFSILVDLNNIVETSSQKLFEVLHGAIYIKQTPRTYLLLLKSLVKFTYKNPTCLYLFCEKWKSCTTYCHLTAVGKILEEVLDKNAISSCSSGLKPSYFYQAHFYHPSHTNTPPEYIEQLIYSLLQLLNAFLGCPQDLAPWRDSNSQERSCGCHALLFSIAFSYVFSQFFTDKFKIQGTAKLEKLVLHILYKIKLKSGATYEHLANIKHLDASQFAEMLLQYNSDKFTTTEVMMCKAIIKLNPPPAYHKLESKYQHIMTSALE